MDTLQLETLVKRCNQLKTRYVESETMTNLRFILISDAIRIEYAKMDRIVPAVTTFADIRRITKRDISEIEEQIKQLVSDG